MQQPAVLRSSPELSSVKLSSQAEDGLAQDTILCHTREGLPDVRKSSGLPSNLLVGSQPAYGLRRSELSGVTQCS